jgi:UDP-2-acetamido-3-amino-2,3-dideoxy-glucuronate N-acetyltransferase
MREVFVHEHALCESTDIGPRTHISAFAHVLPGARLGSDCKICDGVLIEGGAVVGDRVTVKPGVRISEGLHLEDDVYVGANTTFAGGPAPDGDDRRNGAGRTVVRAGASIGAGATILSGLEVGREAIVSAGAVVTHSVPPHAVVTGNPARIQRYVGTHPGLETAATEIVEPGMTPMPVRGVHVQRFPEFSDLRGSLTVGDIPSDYVPFVPRRWFVVYDVPGRELRGEHAHRECHQFMICVAGNLRVAVDDGERRAEVLLDGPAVGIYVPPMVWASQFRHEHNPVLLVLASHPYDPADYIREYEQFREEVSRRPPRGDGAGA